MCMNIPVSGMSSADDVDYNEFQGTNLNWDRLWQGYSIGGPRSEYGPFKCLFRTVSGW